MEKFSDTLLERQPTGRVGKPEDLAGLIIYLSTMAGAHSVGEYSDEPKFLIKRQLTDIRKCYRARWWVYEIWMEVKQEG